MIVKVRTYQYMFSIIDLFNVGAYIEGHRERQRQSPNQIHRIFLQEHRANSDWFN